MRSVESVSRIRCPKWELGDLNNLQTSTQQNTLSRFHLIIHLLVPETPMQGWLP